MSLAPGTRLGRYEIIARLGTGGMGEVYRARDRQLRRDVAIKVLPSSMSNNPDRLRRFEQEAQAAGSLNHPNILAIYDVGAQDGCPFLVSELLEGETLQCRLAGPPLPVRVALDLAMQTVQGLAAAHERGIVHRDLKPGNVFVTTDDRVKILDFGLAKLMQPESVVPGPDTAPMVGPATKAGVMLGTVGYMSPEQATGVPADHRSDIFSFGVILYELLAGKRPFVGGSEIETLSAILRDEPPPVRPAPGGDVDAATLRAVDRVMRRCLEKRRDDRFQSARDLGFALAEAAGVLDRPLGTRSNVEPQNPPSRGHPLGRSMGLAAAVAALIAVGAAALLLNDGRPHLPATPVTEGAAPPAPVNAVRPLPENPPPASADPPPPTQETAARGAHRSTDDAERRAQRLEAGRYLRRARDYLERGDPDGAAAEVAKARNVDPSHPSLPRMSGDIEKLKRLEEARRVKRPGQL